MTGRDLLYAINEIDDDLILQAGSTRGDMKTGAEVVEIEPAGEGSFSPGRPSQPE